MPTAILNADLRPLAEAASLVIIDQGRIAAVLPMAARDQVSLAGHEIVDASGRTVLPGIDDSHLHGYEFGRSLTAHDLRGCTSLEEFQARLRPAKVRDVVTVDIPFPRSQIETRNDHRFADLRTHVYAMVRGLE